MLYINSLEEYKTKLNGLTGVGEQIPILKDGSDDYVQFIASQ